MVGIRKTGSVAQDRRPLRTREKSRSPAARAPSSIRGLALVWLEKTDRHPPRPLQLCPERVLQRPRRCHPRPQLLTTMSFFPRISAAVCASLGLDSELGLFGFTSTPMVVAKGAILVSRSSRFAMVKATRKLTPVRLAPGRLRVATQRWRLGGRLGIAYHVAPLI